jgi:pimeloyl-ACP methyl ester carboxylesterase
MPNVATEKGKPSSSCTGTQIRGYSFGRVLPLLSPEYHAFALTQRGQGDSDKPECCYTVDDYAADVDAFTDALGIE